MTKRSEKVIANRIQQEKFKRELSSTIKALNQAQSDLFESLAYDSIVVAQGSAGTGKTMISCYHAAKQLHYKKVNKIVLIRAYQPLAGRTIGMLPGSEQEKLTPFYRQMLDYFEDFLGKATTEIHLKNKTIEICSLETIRGRSWSDAVVIVDEAQCLFVPEIQALTTRIGDRCQMIFCGDNSGLQTDVKNSMDGLSYLNKVVEKYNIQNVGVVTFKRADICRSDLVKDFVIAYEEELIADETKQPTIISQQEINKQYKK